MNRAINKGMRVKPIELSETEREQLEIIVKKGSDWRERERAQTILMLSDGQTVIAVAAHQGVKPEAIRERRRKWWRNGLASLPDQPRSGAPSKLTDANRNQLKGWIEAEPLTCSRLTAECGVAISAGTLRNELKRMGYVWKRTRYSLKKSEIPSASNKRDTISQN
ncbi:helix-turn-helix domain-containing protein [Methylomonas rivi]|uniref:Helix-turn-helix domain-containing protein n=1 Tax=Methylomonas rivi TaxID=2952226 RepID=A0ABT1UA18_9GAMM|nr:helix-turn-helix domain-containing protein [Methylomonas sp. WSC-6]MCQ8130647.1 helix-turn-helix domain-containing protein [Methylomonas sp. WSC-6]